MTAPQNPVARLGAALRNGLEIAWLGGLGADEPSPYEVVTRVRVAALRRYFPAQASESRPAILLVPPLMLTAEIYDVSAESSGVAALAALGLDPWVVDFGAPEKTEGGLSRTLEDHVLAVADAVDRVRTATGRDVHVGGYSQGGMFAYQAAAVRRGEGLASVITFGSPVDVRRGLPPGIPEEIAAQITTGLGLVLAPLFSRAWVPAWASRLGFRMLDPMKDLQQRVQFLAGLYDREALRKREGQRRFLATDGWVAYPGPALGDFLEQFLVHNRLLSGGLVIDGRTVALADISCPILAFVGEIDEIARPRAVRAIRHAAPRTEIFEVPMRAGHFGLVVGSKANEITWPTVAEWVRWRENEGERPARLRELGDDEPEGVEAASTATAVADDVRFGADLFAEAGRGAVRTIGRAVADRAISLQRLAENVLPQLPRLIRLDAVRRDTPISLGLLLDERAATDPEATLFLFEGRAYSYADANRRVDAVVRGLLSVGIRHGSHVGILMRTRPSALAMVAAVSRLGAVAVLLRPDGDLAQELRLGGVESLVADPEAAAQALEASRALAEPLPVFVLGGGGPNRPLPEGAFDLERIDPAAVEAPDWFRANPGLAEEVGVILFSGRGTETRANQITNRRFAVSAFGTASAAALGSRDTVYCATPLHHPTGLLVAVGGALVAGTRLAMGTCFEPAAFWDDVRRYGVSVVFYTGAMLSPLVHAPHDPAERHHPIRLFAGSGMPRPIWQRVQGRFGPVDVLEFWASTEGNAVLANLSGEKVGSVGRPLPGSADIAIAEWDFGDGRLAIGDDGFASVVEENEIGLLLVRVERERGALAGRPLRGLFEPGDAWVASGDLFRRDEDGDYWRVDSLADAIVTADGLIATIAIENALGELDTVELAVAYGCVLGDAQVPVAAVKLRSGAALDPAALGRVVAERLDPASFPRLVRIVDAIPLTAGFRPIKEPLRAAGIDLARDAGRAFELDSATGTYLPIPRT